MEDAIMKKVYINPDMEIIKLNAHYQLMAGSEITSFDEVPEEYGARDLLSGEDDFFDE